MARAWAHFSAVLPELPNNLPIFTIHSLALGKTFKKKKRKSDWAAMPDINQNHSLQSQTDFLSYLEMAGTVPWQYALLGWRSLRLFEKFSRSVPLGCLLKISPGVAGCLSRSPGRLSSRAKPRCTGISFLIKGTSWAYINLVKSFSSKYTGNHLGKILSRRDTAGS